MGRFWDAQNLEGNLLYPIFAAKKQKKLKTPCSIMGFSAF